VPLLAPCKARTVPLFFRLQTHAVLGKNGESPLQESLTGSNGVTKLRTDHNSAIGREGKSVTGENVPGQGQPGFPA
jgi:hypothetical protein